jgi:hypothetical protein
METSEMNTVPPDGRYAASDNVEEVDWEPPPTKIVPLNLDKLPSFV